VIKTQLLDPHWEKKAARGRRARAGHALRHPIYSNRRVAFAKIDPHGAREIFIREALVAGDWDTPLPFAAANRKAIAQVQELEHKSRRQDVLVDDELIYDFYASSFRPMSTAAIRSSAGIATRSSASPAC
jgi:ATP-dependent helicase HrpA